LDRLTCDLQREAVVGRSLVEGDVKSSGRPEWLLQDSDDVTVQDSHDVDGRPLHAARQPLRLAPDERIGERMESIHAELAQECDVISGMLQQLGARRQQRNHRARRR